MSNPFIYEEDYSNPFFFQPGIAYSRDQNGQLRRLDFLESKPYVYFLPPNHSYVASNVTNHCIITETNNLGGAVTKSWSFFYPAQGDESTISLVLGPCLGVTAAQGALQATTLSIQFKVTRIKDLNIDMGTDTNIVQYSSPWYEINMSNLQIGKVYTTVEYTFSSIPGLVPEQGLGYNTSSQEQIEYHHLTQIAVYLKLACLASVQVKIYWAGASIIVRPFLILRGAV